MSDYRPVPDGATRLRLKRWGCGDECNCNSFKVMATVPRGHRLFPSYASADCLVWSVMLWEGGWFWPSDEYEPRDEWMSKLRAEVLAACANYGLEAELGEDVWDWEAERLL